MIKVEIRKASDLSFKELKEFKEINGALEYCFDFDYEIIIYDHYVE
jgi:hypothetical protein